MPTETELKLAVSRTALERLAAATARRTGVDAAAEQLHTVYYDTPRLDLWRKGLALRVRRDARGWTQCVKGGGSVQAGLHRRIESEAALEGEAPEIERIEDPELAALVARVRGKAALRPVFSTEFTRRTWALSPAPDALVELSLDRGTIEAGTRRERLSEIELELKQGPASRLYEIALEFERDTPLCIEHRSKAERGYALARGAGSGPVKPKPSQVTETMTSVEAFRTICFACIEHLQANRAGMLAGGDAEYLHQMRVALRRLRSAFRVFSTLLPQAAVEPTLVELRWLARALGPARDWDVFGATTLAPIGAQLPGHRGLRAVQRACERLREGARRRAHRAVASRRYQRMLLGLGAWLAADSWIALLPLADARRLRAPVAQHAAVVLERRLRRVRARGRGFSRLAAADLHRLRIAAKRLRYTAMFFAPLFPGRRTRAMLRSLAALQDALGGISDCNTGERLIGEARASARSALGRQALELLANWNDSARADHRRALRASWKAFRASGRFWTPPRRPRREESDRPRPRAAS